MTQWDLYCLTYCGFRADIRDLPDESMAAAVLATGDRLRCKPPRSKADLERDTAALVAPEAAK